MISQEQANYQRYFHFMPPDVAECDEYAYERAGKTKHWVRNARAWAIPVRALLGPPNVFLIGDQSAEYWHCASDCPNHTFGR